MIFINPQWQGSGFTDDLKVGAETFISYFKDSETTIIPLSTKPLTTINNIKCFEPILEQTKLFKEIISNSKLDKLSVIGGDCGIEVIPISYLNKIYQEDIGVIYIDAHADLNTRKAPKQNISWNAITNAIGRGKPGIYWLTVFKTEPTTNMFCWIEGLR
ncbi:arginase family protein [Paraflavitalea speifideaquila]|uniref:arginase family protein n=1 Tax=Paraflavitalea speifideaquila TaxID=3076558 RepID=UPI0028EBB685|nr:arginase family protein [Paraflavitalea speifideiaquila]